jgi:two-component system nitrogen regulation response regulator GlnG
VSTPAEIWVVDDDQSIRWVLERALTQAGIGVLTFETGVDVADRLELEAPDAIITDIRMPGLDGLSLLERIADQHPSLPVIVMTGFSDLDSAVSAYRGGAFEYLPKPFDVDEAVELARRAIGHARRDSETGVRGHPAKTEEIIGSAPAMQEVFRAIGRLSSSNITVLITGASGTGKELVAHALHRHSTRARMPFIAMNTAAIPRELLESELFGHERGAFTGAQTQRRGRFEQANGGTLFLDEIGDMPAELQTRLLRVLADGDFYRVGGHVPLKVDVRIIAATHQDLEARVRAGSFREDLFHRLNVIRVHVPMLRERKSDIPILAQHFLEQAARDLDVAPKRLRPEVEAYLSELEWPGNVRQLDNACRWLTVMASGNDIHLEDLPPELRSHEVIETTEDWVGGFRAWVQAYFASGGRGILKDATAPFEQTMIEVALKFSGGRRRDAADLIGWGRNTITRKIKEHGLGGLETDKRQ